GKATQHVQPDEVRALALAQAGGEAVPGGAGIAGALQPQRTDRGEVTGPEMVGLQTQGVLEVVQRIRGLALPLSVGAQQEIVEGARRLNRLRPDTLLGGTGYVPQFLQVAGPAQVIRLGRR